MKMPFFIGRKNLFYKTALMVLCLLAIAIAAPTVISIKKQTKSIARELLEKNKNISRHLAFSAKNAFWTLNWVFVEKQLQEVVHSEDVAFVGIFKSDGQVYLAAGDTRDREKILIAESLPPKKQIIENNVIAGYDEMSKLIITPIEAGNEIWALIMGVSLRPVAEARALVIQESILTGCLIFVLGVLASFCFARGVVNPITKLAEGTREIAKGNLDHRISLKSNDEIGNLADSFNKMAEDLKRTTTSRDLLVREIKERKYAEAELKASEERSRTVSENAPFGMAIIAANGTYEYINPKFTGIFGYILEDVPTGRSWFSLAFPDDVYREKAVSDWLNDIGPMKIGQSRRRELKVTCKNGTTKDIHINTVKLAGGKQLVTYEDITETRVLEDQLRQAGKMEAVGTLAGGIAHDFNNILQAITGYNQLLMLGKREGEKDYAYHEQIEQSISKASELTRQLLTFSRKVESKMKPVDLNHEVRELEKLLNRTIPKMIKISLRLSEELSTVNADPGQMEQVMMNIALNARDAMSDGGMLTFATENRTIDEAFVRAHHGAKVGNYVKLTISDTGHGMSEETIEHIFEPFYTTKGPGRGTGLGLAMVYGIVRSHQGYIACTSEVGIGTSFDIYLPVLEFERQVSKDDESNEDIVENGHETIMLVDDEESIRNIGKEMLQRCGYDVKLASSGEEALDVYQKEKIDLLILDLDMPGMGGMRCLGKIVEIDSEAKIIIASGYSNNGGPETFLKAGAKAFMGKPYRFKDMLKTIRSVLN